MIRINLLPEEERVVERTPIARFLVILGGVFLSCILLVAFAMQLRDKKDVVEAQAELEGKNKQLNTDTKEYDELLAEMADIKKRSEVVDDLRRTRILWSRKLLQFAKLLNGADYAWIDNLSITEGGPGFIWKFQAYTAGLGAGGGADLGVVGRFLDLLDSDPQFKDIFVRDRRDDTKMDKIPQNWSVEPFGVPDSQEGGGGKFLIELKVDKQKLLTDGSQAEPRK